MYRRLTATCLLDRGCGQPSGTGAFAGKEIETPDHLRLKATLYGPEKEGPGIVLFHMCGQDGGRQNWKPIAERLASEGFHVLTYDYRGFGQSPGVRPGDGYSYGDVMKIWRKEWTGDVEAAFHFLVSQPGVDPQRIGAAGAIHPRINKGT